MKNKEQKKDIIEEFSIILITLIILILSIKGVIWIKNKLNKEMNKVEINNSLILLNPIKDKYENKDNKYYLFIITSNYGIDYYRTEPILDENFYKKLIAFEQRKPENLGAEIVNLITELSNKTPIIKIDNNVPRIEQKDKFIIFYVPENSIKYL
jgi:hypothetical protein